MCFVAKPSHRSNERLINAFVIFVNVYYFNRRHVKCSKSWNFEFAQTAKIFSAKFTNRLKNINVYYQRLLTLVIVFIINAFINVYYYFLDV